MAVRTAGLPEITSVVSRSSSLASRLGALIDHGEDLPPYSVVIGEGRRALVQPSGDFADEAFSNALLKRDLAAGTVQAHQFGRDPTAPRRRDGPQPGTLKMLALLSAADGAGPGPFGNRR